MNRKRIVLAGLAIALLLAPMASATTAVKMSEEDLAVTSDLILTGTVTSFDTAWIDRTLYTLVTVQVDDVVKGSAGNAITVMVPGGTDTDRPYPVTVTYAGAPLMMDGEQVFLFLDTVSAVEATYAVAGFSQGKYSIVESPDGVQKVVRDLTDLSLQSAGGGHQRGGASAQPLATFKSDVRAMVEAKVGRAPLQR